MRRCAAALLLLAVSATAVQAQESASPPADSGRIVAFIHWERRDSFVVGGRQPAGPFTRMPIAQVAVTLQGAPTVLGTSRADGYAVLAPLPAGRQRLVFTGDGYCTLQCRVEVEAGRTDTVEVRLIPTKDVPGFNNNAFGCRQPR